MPFFSHDPKHRIKNIIFDFGNVLLDIDIPKSEEELLGLFERDLNYRKVKAEIWALIYSLETNEISENEFRSSIRKIAKRELSDHEIDSALNGILLHFPPHRFTMQEKLKLSFDLYLLSNTNSIHIRWVHHYLKKKYSMVDFENRFFNKVYYSHLVGFRKPGQQIYKHVLKDAGIKPTESLFIDDNEQNIESANKMGIHTILHDPRNDIGEVLKNVGIINVDD